MEYLNLETLIILLPMLFMAGFIDSIAGGGGLISLPAYLLSGLPIHNAIATNKLQSTFGTSLTTFRFIKNGFVNFKLVLPSIIAAILGSSIGSNLTLLLSEKVLNTIMLFVLPLAAILVLNKNSLNLKEDKKLIVSKKTYIIVSLSAFFIGMYDGFYGPGTGTFLIIAFSIFGKMNVKYANGNAKVINLTTNITSLAVFLTSGKVIIPLGLVSALATMSGNYIGSGLAMKSADKFTRPAILLVLFILALKVFNII